MSTRQIDTPAGQARVHVERARDPRGSVVLGHGAGGGIDAPDLRALRALVDEGWTYVRVEQPWRVAGKKVAPAGRTLDVAWREVMAALMKGRWALPGPVVVGGRSAGARVACRTVQDVGADAVLALAFPLHPPGKPGRSRAAEAISVLEAGIPLAIMQGQRDPFGTPDEVRDAVGERAHVFSAKGAHGFTDDPQDVVMEVQACLNYLPRMLAR